MKSQQRLSTSLICVIAAAMPLAAGAATQAASPEAQDVAEQRLDNRGDRIDRRLDHKGDRTRARTGIDRHLDYKGDRIEDRFDSNADRARDAGKDELANKLERKGDRADARLDHKGDRIDRRLDHKGDRRTARMATNSRHRMNARSEQRGNHRHGMGSGGHRKVAGKRRR